MSQPVIKQAEPGMSGFDVNQPLNLAQARYFHASGYGFCIRYLPRTSALVKGNLTLAEVGDILGAGLALGVVQHVPLPGWEPTVELGTQYGQYAGQYASEIGLPAGMNIWLDLEEVSSAATSTDVIGYCNAWWASVSNAGYVPGLYVGWNCGLSPIELYAKLKFSHYWKAYNADMPVATRGYQMIQKTQKTLNGISYDPNEIQSDNLGGLPILLYAS